MSKPAGRTKIKSEVLEKPRAVSGRRVGLFERFKLPVPASAPKQNQIHLAETIVTTPTPKPAIGKRPDVTSPSRLQNSQRPQQRVKGSSAKRAAAKKKPGHARAIFLALLIGIVAYGLSDWNKGKKTSEPVIDEAALKAAEQALRDRVQFHRNLTGGKLNRERIRVEVENQLSAPIQPTETQRAQVNDMMMGVPLVAEPVQNSSYRDRLQAANPDFADSRIMYTLQEQQAANDWEEQARQQYINEFIANAARAGYKVKVDKNGIVTVLGRISPSEAANLPTYPPASGSAR